jgi:hypothetical protein
MQVAVGRGNHADIGADHASAAEALNSRSSRTRSNLAWTVGAIAANFIGNNTPPAACCAMRPGWLTRHR